MQVLLTALLGYHEHGVAVAVLLGIIALAYVGLLGGGANLTADVHPSPVIVGQFLGTKSTFVNPLQQIERFHVQTGIGTLVSLS